MATTQGRKWIRTLIVLGAVAVVLLLVWLLGPRVTFAPAGALPEGLGSGADSIPDSPAGVGDWVASREAEFDDIVEGTEKSFSWATPGAPRREEYAVVYLHGFSATRQETAPFADRLASLLEGNAFHSRLAGHGRTTVEAFGEASAADWYADALEALAIGRIIGRRVVVVGTSTGASLAAVLAENHPEAIHAIVSISPNFGPKNRAAWLTAGPWGLQIGRLVMGEFRSFQPKNELHERYWTTRYPSEAIPAMMSLVSYALSIDHSRIDVPLMTVTAPEDTVVDHGAILRVHGAWGSAVTPPPKKQLLLVEDSEDPGHHVIAGDILSPSTTDRLVTAAVEFVAGLPAE